MLKGLNDLVSCKKHIIPATCLDLLIQEDCRLIPRRDH